MAIKTYSATPYVDDFGLRDLNLRDKTAEEKNYLRILFKPGVSVQVRELNQMQSILQSQIDKLGRGVFKEGPVPNLADKAMIERDLFFVDIDIDDELIGDDGLIPYLDLVKGIQLNYRPDADPLVDYVKAEVLHFEALPDVNTYRFYIKYLTSVQDDDGENVQEFDETLDPAQVVELSEDLIIPNITQTQYSAGQNFGSVINAGRAIQAHVNSGIYFVKGEFVYSEAQDIFAIRPNRTFNFYGDIVFRVKESIYDYEQDASLLDNATGTPNATAPGADRYKIDLTLTIVSRNANADDQSFIDQNSGVFERGLDILGDTFELIKLEQDIIISEARPEFGFALDDILAQRTFEESGNYAVSPYIIDIRDFYNDIEEDDNRGKYTPTEMLNLGITIGDDDISGVLPGELSEDSESDRIQYGDSRYVIGIEPSVSYVQGYRVAVPEKIELVVPKARTTLEDSTQIYTTAQLGSYIIGSAITNLPSFDVDVEATFNSGGTCKIRSIEKVGSTYRLYVYDISGDVDTAATVTQGAFTFTIDGQFNLYGAEHNQSIFPIPYEFVSDVSAASTEFTARTLISDVTSTGAEVTFETPRGRFEEFGNDSFIVVDTGAAGAIINVDDVDIDPENNGTTSKVKLTLASTPVGNVDIIYSYRSTLIQRTKSVQLSGDVVLAATANGTDVENGDTFTLTHHDIIEITSATTVDAGETIDVLNDIVLDNGQRDGYYAKGIVTYVGTGITGTANEGGLKITYTYFSHSAVGDYFARNSYSVPYGEIPSYKGNRLADQLDFRAREGATPDEVGTYLDPNSTIDARVKYYLSRIDKLVVTTGSEFKVIQGVPAVTPNAPETPVETMLLYSIFVPAYTYTVKDIETDYVDNSRKTMRDVGELASRVQNLEFQSQLSMLERECHGKQIFDANPSGDPYDRFKNGIIVDTFSGHSIGQVTDPHYNCSMDEADPVLRPYFETRSVPLTWSSLNNTEVNDGLLSLEMDTNPVDFISQLNATVSLSVNPYDVATWLGNLVLSPSSDEWMETARAPDIVNNVGGNLNELRAEVNRINQLGTQWNSWQTTWSGVNRVTTSRDVHRGGWIVDGRRRGWVRTTTTTTNQGQSARSGLRTTASLSSVTRVKDDKVISVSMVPFIRSRRVYFKGSLFKPNTKLKLFFDGVDITKYATTATYRPWHRHSTVRSFFRKRHDECHTIARNNLVTNNKGEVTGWFVIPNNSEHQFKTGERQVTLSDGETSTDPLQTTFGSAEYVATGRIQTKQRTLVTTRTVRRRVSRVSQSRAVTSSRVTRVTYHDPLAQSFIIGEEPTGLYISEIDLYFQTASREEIPLRMCLVEVENGYPTQRIVPGSEVEKFPTGLADVKVNTSFDASSATTFKFGAPLYLQPGFEYAIVTESNSGQYRQWLCEVGGTDVLTGKFISKNPYLGVSFKSQNGSTWTADQMKDFKMVLRRANFAQSGTVVLDTVGISTAAEDEDEIAGVTASDGPLEFSQLQLNVDFVEHPGTSIKFEISTAGGVEGSYYEIPANENFYLSTSTPLTDNSDIKIKATLSSDNSKISPVLDLDRISLIAVKNVINSAADIGTTEEASDHGVAEAVYMTKEVLLDNPADRLDTFLNINRPIAEADAQVYVRFKRSEATIEEVNFEKITSDTLRKINTIGEYSEVPFIKDFSGTGEQLFSSFQVKIVLVSTDHAQVPSVKDFRSIATT